MTQPVSGKPRKEAHWASLPNLLTYGRIVAVPLVVLCFFLEGRLQSSDFARWSALAIFIAASITDFFDGYMARAWEATSHIGRFLDPIADKLLVASALLMLVHDGRADVLPSIAILCREILVSGLREFLAELRISVPVSQLAKFKTTAQLVAISLLLLAPAIPGFMLYDLGSWLLWLAAALTLVTGYLYLKVGIKHLAAEDAKQK